MSNLEKLSDDQLGQAWASRFVWYLMEMERGHILLDDETHGRMVSELREIDEEMRRRGLPADDRYADAFEKREALPAEDMERLMLAYKFRDGGLDKLGIEIEL